MANRPWLVPAAFILLGLIWGSSFLWIKIGVDETFSGLMSNALGFGAALGVTMGVIRKIRVLFWSLIGLILLR